MELKKDEFGPPILYEPYSKFFIRKFTSGFVWGFGISLFVTSQFAFMTYVMKRGMVFTRDLYTEPVIWSSMISLGFGFFEALSSNYRQAPQKEEVIDKSV